MTRSTRFTLPALLAAAILLPAPAGAAPEKSFDEVTEVIEVEIPVHVVADGQAVRGLSAADFEVYEGRRQRRITGFEAIDLALLGSPGADPRAVADLPPAARRHILLLFDLTFARPASIVRAREAARELVLAGLHPGDLVAVATYAVRQGARLVLGFTPDRQQVELAIDTLGLPQLVDGVNDPLGLVLADTFIRSVQIDGRSYLSNSPGGSLLDPTKPAAVSREDLLKLINDEIIESLRDYSALHQRAERDIQRNFAISFTDGLAALGRLLASVEGEKQVILLSEGFDSSLLLGTTDEDVIAEQAESVAFGELWKVDSDQRFGSTAALQVIQQMADSFRRSNAIVHAVDIGGLRAGGGVDGGTLASSPTRSSEDSLFVIADSTGGELFRNFNDLGVALDRLMEQTGVTYVLRFDPGDLELDGSYHPIEVRLKNAPRGTRLVHRPGFYAPKPAAFQHPLERRLSAADLVLRAHDSGAIASSVLTAAFPRADAGAAPGAAAAVFVPVLVRIDGEDLLAGRSEGLASLELYAYAFDREGRVGDFFSQSLGLNVAKVRAQLRRGTLDFYGQLDLPPGEYSLRVLLQDSTSGRWSFRRTDLSVPGARTGEPALLALLFPDLEDDRRLLVRQQVGEGEAPYPFVDGGATFTPATRPVVRGRGATELFLVTSEPVGRPEVTAWVSTSGGERIEVQSVVSGAPGSGSPGSPLLPIRLEAGGLAAGEYVLTVSLGTGEGAQASTRSIPVTIVAGVER